MPRCLARLRGHTSPAIVEDITTTFFELRTSILGARLIIQYRCILEDTCCDGTAHLVCHSGFVCVEMSPPP
jgi:hypothetical protein